MQRKIKLKTFFLSLYLVLTLQTQTPLSMFYFYTKKKSVFFLPFYIHMPPRHVVDNLCKLRQFFSLSLLFFLSFFPVFFSFICPSQGIFVFFSVLITMFFLFIIIKLFICYRYCCCCCWFLFFICIDLKPNSNKNKKKICMRFNFITNT